MSLETKINEDLKTAMKNKEQAALRGIRAIKAAILLARTDSAQKKLDEAAEVKLLQKLVKQRQDSLAIYEEQGRKDLAKVEKEEIEVIQRYLPEQMDEKELKTVLAQIIEDTGASGMKDMGKVMGTAVSRLGGKADSKTISIIVKDLLNQ